MDESKKPKTRAQHKKLAELLTQDVPVGEALRKAGWSDRQSLKGWAAVPDKVFAQLPKKAQKLAALGKNTDRETRKDLVRGRLIQNTISGKDGGSLSAKILGSDSDLNMWQSELQQGVIVLNAPAQAADKEALLKAARECEETEPAQ